jgi:predicted AlkP superfamily pyrophosphatase or phosphodiesterase
LRAIGLIALCLLLVVLATALGSRSSHPWRPIVILVSLDGWRWDYIDRFAPPTISELSRRGVTSEGLIPIFPSKTFPNHYTIITGLYAWRHGIVSNNMLDPELPGRFSLSNREVQQDTRWWGGEPLWVTAEKQGQIAATMFWPGSDAEIAGDRPTFYRVFDNAVTNEARVDQLLQWLDRGDTQRPTFLTLYFSEVDTAGHEYGPEAPQTRAAVLNLDGVIARLTAGIERLGLSGRVNLLLVSDHGMAPLSRDRVIVLDDYLDLSTVDIIDSTPIVGLRPRPGTSVEQVYEALKGKHPALEVYTKATLPEQFGLRDHPRVPEVMGIADDGWHITTRSRLAGASAEEFSGGNHGYDPKHRSMHGLFVAVGPQFKTGLVVPPFENVHIYELICRVLKLKPAPNDGDPEVTAGFVRPG